MDPLKMIIPAEKVDMGGFLINQPLPHYSKDYVDPFLLIHHGLDTLKGGQKQKDTGIGPHPHRGFSPVTIIFKGEVHHRDSRGNSRL